MVIALWMAMFFALVSATAWLLLFPSARDSAITGAGRLRSRLATIAARWQTQASNHVHDSSQALHHAGRRALRWFSRHRAWLIGGSLLVIVPPLLILQLRQRPALESYETTEQVASNPQILELLRGERLVPPPELPPDVFVAAEAVLLEMGPAAVAPQAIVSANRKWDRIDARFQQRVLAVYQVMREQYGYEMVLVEGYRSPQRQAELARKGGSTTRAGAGQSCHQYGLAVDSAPLRDGKLQWDMADPWTRRGYLLYGELAQQAGLEWGGAWRSIKDYVHLESRHACREARREVRAG